MKASTNERMKTLHDKLEKYKDDILKGKAEGKSNLELSREYGINNYTLAEWVYFWRTGTKKVRTSAKIIRRKKTEKKTEFSQALKNQQKINSEYNKKLIKRVKVDNGQDEQMIRYICGVKV